jgi:hypothetical protein
MSPAMLALTRLYTRHYRLYVALRLTRPWNPKHVLDHHANALWRGEVSRFHACDPERAG